MRMVAAKPFSAAAAPHKPHQQQRRVVCSAAEPQAAKAAGRMTYRPESYAELVQDATNSVLAAIADGIQLMEVEFPAVPANIDGGFWMVGCVWCGVAVRGAVVAGGRVSVVWCNCHSAMHTASLLLLTLKPQPDAWRHPDVV